MPVTFATSEDLTDLNRELGRLRADLAVADATAQIAASEAEVAREEIAELVKRVAALEKPPPPPPPPVPQTRRLVGGWRLVEPFARGSIAIDFDTRRLFLAGHAQERYVRVYDLPPMGEGDDPAAWPALTPRVTIPKFWDDARDGDAYGLCWWRGKLWVSPRIFYDTAPAPDLRLYATDGEVMTVDLPRQKFAGFVKRGPGVDPFLGGGCYQSGQGSASGNTAATLGGEVMLTWGWPAMPTTAADWNARQPRPANYSVKADSWVGWNPRNGEGRWASDRVYGGGLVLPEGVTYWCRLGTGDLDYARQSETFGATESDRTYAFRFDPRTWALKGWEETTLGQIGGQEIDAQGRVYLCERDAWTSARWKADPVLKVFAQ